VKPELIERFFLKRCSAEEAKNVATYLKANPNVLEEYLSKHEWDSAIHNEELPDEFWNEIWQNIQQKNKAKVVLFRMKNISAAACIILLAGIAYFYFNTPGKTSKQVVAAETKNLPHQSHKTIANTTNTLMSIVLEDSSVITLSPAAVVQYDVPFPNNKRDIILEGEAEFHVAKNKYKPFTVYCGALATTALGTIFSVKKISNKNIIIVKLLQGKIVVHSTNNNLKGWNREVYLSPGQQLQFSQQSALLAVTKIDSIRKPLIAIKINKSKENVDSANGVLAFRNSLLPDVMNKLSAYYNVTIRYDSLLIDTMNFTGTISKKDSLPFILTAIAQMNNLKIAKDSSGFIVSKPEY